MSKIGKKKILIPKEVNLSINGGSIDVKGPLGSKKINLDTESAAGIGNMTSTVEIILNKI